MRSLFLASTVLLGLAACTDLNTTETALAPSNDGRDRSAIIKNETDGQMYRVYALNVATGKWTENLLAGNRLHRKSETVVDIDDGSGACMYVFRAHMSKGQKVQSDPIDVCRLGTWRVFTPRR